MFRILEISSKSILALALLVPLGIANAKSQERVLYSFGAHSGDGEDPAAGVIADKSGNLYGTTQSGGNSSNEGTIFKLAADGTETVLYDFCSQSNCTDGKYPQSGPILDASGNLYGTTGYGGAHQYGTVYKLTTKDVEAVLYSFEGGKDGSTTSGSLIADKAGNLYGTTIAGGVQSTNCLEGSCGTVFKVTPDGTETVLYAFQDGADGAFPNGPLNEDKDGNLYGTTYYGGGTGCEENDGCGTVFELAPNGTETVLYSFCVQQNCSDGDYPAAVITAKGHLYGTTLGGGTHGGGIVFRVKK